MKKKYLKLANKYENYEINQIQFQHKKNMKKLQKLENV